MSKKFGGEWEYRFCAGQTEADENTELEIQLDNEIYSSITYNPADNNFIIWDRCDDLGSDFDGHPIKESRIKYMIKKHWKFSKFK